ncbi:hypothetical protein, partial [Faecalibaculum rodentium]|uniref:hypothetical protein n=1 Tax=Faecalibaculum rodentium TaxID=1702221 RepID=UPI002614CA10
PEVSWEFSFQIQPPNAKRRQEVHFSDAFSMSFCIYEPILAFDFSTVKEISIFFSENTENY